MALEGEEKDTYRIKLLKVSVCVDISDTSYAWSSYSRYLHERLAYLGVFCRAARWLGIVYYCVSAGYIRTGTVENPLRLRVQYIS